MKGINPLQAKRMAASRRSKMLKLLDEGMSKADVARIYGISRQRAAQIVKAGRAAPPAGRG
jgi:hypothetical protein